MSTGDSASETMPRWKCSHAASERLASIVKYYTHRLKTHQIDYASARMWVGMEPSSAAALAIDNAVDQDGASPAPKNININNSSDADDSSSNSNDKNNNNSNRVVDDDEPVADDSSRHQQKNSSFVSQSSPSLTAMRPAPDTEQQILKVAIAMARKAWENPPTFLLPEDDPEPLPAHCINFDILSAPTLKSAIISVQGFIGGDNNQQLNKAVGVLDELLKKGSTDFHTALFAFADHPSVVSGDVGDDRDTIVQCFSKMSSLPVGDFGVKWSSRVKDIADFIERNSANFAKQGHTLLFDSLSIDNGTLLDRCVAWLLLTIPALNQEALMRIGRLLQHADEVRLARMLGRISPESMQILVENLQNVFTVALFEAESRRASAHASLNLLGAMLSLLDKANTAIVSRGLIKYSSFYNATAIEFDEDGIISDFKHWLKVREDPTSNLFTFSRFPCLVDTRFKSKLLQFEGIIGHQNAQREAILTALFSGGRRRNIENEMYCILQVRRDRLLETTVDQMTKNSGRFSKPLKVVFVGEEGIDAGGVTKEFFQLMTRQLFNPGFGMFTEKEPNRVLWFMPDVGTEQLQREFFLVGQLLGLAAYNSVIIDVSFPQLLYRKILGFEPDMDDLKEIDPELANGLQKLLEYDENAPGAGKIEDVFCRTFTYEHELFGSKLEIPLCPGGADKELTAENRNEYVKLTIKYLLSDGVERSFEQFKRGFLSVAARDLISTMHPEELEMLLCGQKSLDFKELQESCTYEGYTENDAVVQWFWRIVRNELSVEQQKKFLHFATGSDRIPVGGLKELKFKIGKNGDTDDQLPTSHTCFNHFLLPKYSSEAVLKIKLLLAIENCEGFGLQ